MSTQIYHFYNRKHYGDNILNLKFFYNIAPLLKEKHIQIIYYYNAEYNKNVNELERYIDKDVLSLKRLAKKPSDAHELFMGNKIGKLTHVRNFDKYYDEFYKNILNILKLEHSSISASFYQPEPYLHSIYETLDPKFKDLDILILNSVPCSSQYLYFNKDEFDAMSTSLAKKFKVATSTFVNDEIPCTWNDKLTIQDIGAISTHAKYIVAIQSGPLTACSNSITKAYVKKWFIFCDGIRYSQIPVHNNCRIEDVMTFFNDLI